MPANETFQLKTPTLWDCHGHLFSWATTPKKAFIDRKAYPLRTAVPVLWDILGNDLLEEMAKAAQHLYNLAAKKDIDAFPLAREYASTWQVAAEAMAVEYRLAGVTDFNLLGIDFYGWNYRWPILSQWAIMKAVKRICEKEGVRCHLVAGLDPARPGAARLIQEHHKEFEGVKVYLPISECTPTQLTDLASACAFFGLPMYSHCSPGGIGDYTFKASPDYAFNMLMDVQDLHWCYCHGGGGRGAWRRAIEMQCLEFEGVYMDLAFREQAFFTPEPFFKRLEGYAEHEEGTPAHLQKPAIMNKILWGSDRPLPSIYYTLEELINAYKENLSFTYWESISLWNIQAFHDTKKE